MDTVEMNRRAGELLRQWDPFRIGEEQYGIEVEDVLAALQRMDHPTDLAKIIQRAYEFSFKQWIPIERCIDVSYKLLAIKFEAKCII
ncbi:DUF1871 family protein [Planococcus lenghuensis]|uniref:DUF1871 family protein n=1 Tax=Planococcus lenghuensis TaxID=2213202 RepID=A0A1Q2KX75_9BACL|nr:DUF1871 family protein [Planococcus lenghuensis]AQQ52726.1 hypothetical protein B0X71_06175 [Planococcus lenghuensis]